MWVRNSGYLDLKSKGEKKMEKLVNSGLPLYLDEDTNIMALSALLSHGDYGRKRTGEMKGLLADETTLDEDELFYDVYRNIAYPKDEELLKNYDYRYDITIIMPGLVNGECKKTSGHYHGYGPTKKNTYGEVYEVIKGTALYILQKSPDFDKTVGDLTLDDVIFVTVNAGQSIIVPPNYGHVSINIGMGPLVFSNLAFASCPINYDAVKKYHGMAYYIKREDGLLKFGFNQNYKNMEMPKVRKAIVRENPKLGITFGLPVYQSFIRNPEAFDFLGNPDAYIDEIMSMLEFE